MLINQRWSYLLTALALVLVVLYLRQSTAITSVRSFASAKGYGLGGPSIYQPSSPAKEGSFSWSSVPERYPLSQFEPLPQSQPNVLPRIQHKFEPETPTARKVRQARQAAVLGNFTHSWNGYKKYAWGKDEAGPLSGSSYDHFGGWAASLVDGLDALWIMGLTREFEEAVRYIQKIDFSTCALGQLNVFETIIRYMGGLLGAHDLTNGAYPVLLEQATELGEMVYRAFDTPNRMPITRWDFLAAKNGFDQIASDGTLIAEIGSINLEMTRLAQVTGNNKYYDAVKRIMDILEEEQQMTKLPGLFPIQVDPRNENFHEGSLFTLGGMVDSLYEYLPKAHLLLHGAVDTYKTLYDRAMIPIQKHLIYRPMSTDGADVRFAGQASVNFEGEVVFEPQAQHLTCFVGGMVGLASRAFEEPNKMELGRQLTDGCTWGYDVMPRGIMPEIMHVAACKDRTGECPFNETIWHHEVMAWTNDGRETPEEKIKFSYLPKSIASVDDTRYGLRPEAIESVFVLYRLTGDTALQDKAWDMFNSIVAETTTDIGAAALSDCVTPGVDGRTDRMESFWFAETLKYFYLVFSEPDLVSLDEFVLNTEAHPFRYRDLSEG